MYLVVTGPEAEDYKKELVSKFPQLSVHAVSKEEDIPQHADKVEIFVTLYRIPDEVYKRAVNLKWVQALTTGVNYVLDRPSLRKEVIVTSCRGIHGPQMSEMAFLLMLALNRNFPQVVRNQDREIWGKWPGKLLYQKNLGVFGVGVIGEEISKKAKAFGMTVYGFDIVKRDVKSVDHFLGPEDLPRVAKDLDYLVLVAPATSDTNKVINSKFLSTMKPTAFVINIARGELVDNDALIQSLETGKIAGAALDALVPEPLPKGHPLWKTKNVIITPHVGGMSDIYMEQVMPIVQENLRRFLQGERKNLINYIER
jgi:D-2-hydroxyacid dehydrogenase (NADP+)